MPNAVSVSNKVPRLWDINFLVVLLRHSRQHQLVEIEATGLGLDPDRRKRRLIVLKLSGNIVFKLDDVEERRRNALNVTRLSTQRAKLGIEKATRLAIPFQGL